MPEPPRGRAAMVISSPASEHSTIERSRPSGHARAITRPAVSSIETSRVATSSEGTTNTSRQRPASMPMVLLVGARASTTVANRRTSSHDEPIARRWVASFASRPGQLSRRPLSSPDLRAPTATAASALRSTSTSCAPIATRPEPLATRAAK
jgi:hypothetical protein